MSPYCKLKTKFKDLLKAHLNWDEISYILTELDEDLASEYIDIFDITAVSIIHWATDITIVNDALMSSISGFLVHIKDVSMDDDDHTPKEIVSTAKAVRHLQRIKEILED